MIKTTPHNGVIIPRHDKNTSLQDYITRHNEETAKPYEATTTHNEDATQHNVVTTTNNDETTQNNDKQPHKKVMAFHALVFKSSNSAECLANFEKPRIIPSSTLSQEFDSLMCLLLFYF